MSRPTLPGAARKNPRAYAYTVSLKRLESILSSQSGDPEDGAVYSKLLELYHERKGAPIDFTEIIRLVLGNHAAFNFEELASEIFRKFGPYRDTFRDDLINSMKVIENELIFNERGQYMMKIFNFQIQTEWTTEMQVGRTNIKFGPSESQQLALIRTSQKHGIRLHWCSSCRSMCSIAREEAVHILRSKQIDTSSAHSAPSETTMFCVRCSIPTCGVKYMISRQQVRLGGVCKNCRF
jgi:hypothetical protein